MAVADKEPGARIATNKQQNSSILFLQINLVVKDQTTYHQVPKPVICIHFKLNQDTELYQVGHASYKWRNTAVASRGPS